MSHVSSGCSRKSGKNRADSSPQPEPKRSIRPGLTVLTLVGLAVMFAAVAGGLLFIRQLEVYPLMYGLLLR